MRAVIGLGNPGKRYANTRHNAGFRALDVLAAAIGAEGWKERSGCEYAKGMIEAETVLLIKPQQYMNLSGQAAQPLLAFFKVEPKECIVCYDELDFAPGVVRLKVGGSGGGHNGVGDLIRALGSDAFIRIRIGIGHPRDTGKPIEVSDWVLGTPGADERTVLEKAVETAAKTVQSVIAEGFEKAQQKLHREV